MHALSLQLIFVIISIVCFLLVAFGAAVPRVNLLALGLAFFAASFL